MKTGEGKFLKEDLSNYSDKEYKKPSVTVDVIVCTIKNDDLFVLLIKRKYPPFKNFWAIPGGFVNIDLQESLEDAATRELEEETNVKNIYIEQLKTYGDPYRDPRSRIITVVYFALVPENKIDQQFLKAKDDAKEIDWFSINNLPDLAFDHRKIIEDLKTRIQGKISYTPIAFEFLPKRFTWKELQNTYEVILNKKLLTSNFRRKIKSMYVIKDIKKEKSTTKGRPSRLLEFVKIKKL